MITNGGTGALIGIAQSYLRGKAGLVFEPYYSYHRRILEEFGSKTETFELDADLTFEKDALLARCKKLRDRPDFPLKAIIVCTPANPSGKVMSQTELEAIAEVAQELDLLVISDEVYEHYVTGENPHIPIASLPGMWERTITVNSFSKSWNISGWRLGYAYGKGELLPDQQRRQCHLRPPGDAAPGRFVDRFDGWDEGYYPRLRETFDGKRFTRPGRRLRPGFDITPGSAFTCKTHTEQYKDAIAFIEMLMRRRSRHDTRSSRRQRRVDPYVRICTPAKTPSLELWKVETVLMKES
jgi:aminotransferase